jgi:hypothetical protein
MSIFDRFLSPPETLEVFGERNLIEKEPAP